MPQKIIYQSPQMDNGQIYNKEVQFTLENYGLINMMFLEFTAQAAGSTNYPYPSSPYLIKDVSLNSFRNPIAHITTSYTLGRLDELDSDLYQQIIQGSTFNGDLTASQSIALPLFFWAIDGQKLDTRKYPNLTIRATTKDSYTDMGLSSGLSSLSIRLKVVYDDPKLYKEVVLKNPYNVYRVKYPITSTVEGTNEITVKINNPYKVSNMYFMLRKSSSAKIKGEINKIELSGPQGSIGIYDDLTNYYINKKNSANFSNTFAIQLADRYKVQEDYFQLTGQNSPLIAKITFNIATGVSGAYDLFVASEYYSNIVESDGMLVEEIKGSFIRF